MNSNAKCHHNDTLKSHTLNRQNGGMLSKVMTASGFFGSKKNLGLRLLVSAKSLADSQTIIFTCFCLDTKATKSQGQDHRPLRGQPKLPQVESRAKLAWAMPRQRQLGDSQQHDLQEICHKRNFVKVKPLVYPFAGAAPPSCPWPPHPAQSGFQHFSQSAFF